jgi:methionine-rich copper-binding protein CopC
MTLKLTCAGLALALAGLATGASAHARLVRSTPADGAAGPAPKQIVLTFSEKLQPRFSSATLTMPGMNNMAAPAKVAVGKDRLTLMVTPTQPLSPGAYAVNWRAVTADTHKVQGKVSFTVR